MTTRKFQIYRGDNKNGELINFDTEVKEGMVVLDVIHKIQAEQANDLAVRWNCKAGKCGSCSMEINGKPKLSCMTRMNEYRKDETIRITPMKTFPVIKDLVTDVSWNYNQNKRIKPVKLALERKTEKGYVMYQKDVDRVQEFRKCIECYLCQNVCHVLRDHDKKDEFIGPRFMIRVAGLEMHPLDINDRIPELVFERFSYSSDAPITQVIDIVDRTNPISQVDQKLDHRHQIIQRQQTVFNWNIQPKFLVELDAPDH